LDIERHGVCTLAAATLFFIETPALRAPLAAATGEKCMAKKADKASVDLKLAPLGDRVVVKRAAAEKKTVGGIVLPESATDKPQRGEILAVGEGHTKNNGLKVALTVRPGDLVVFSSYAGDEFKVNEETYLLMRESDILAVYA
jgi:chaperonin GroES